MEHRQHVNGGPGWRLMGPNLKSPKLQFAHIPDPSPRLDSSVLHRGTARSAPLTHPPGIKVPRDKRHPGGMDNLNTAIEVRTWRRKLRVICFGEAGKDIAEGDDVVWRELGWWRRR